MRTLWRALLAAAILSVAAGAPSPAGAAIPAAYFERELFVLPKTAYDRTEAMRMQRRILAVAPPVLESLVYAGVRIKLVNGRITDEPEMAAFRGVVPRGWEGTGVTWDDIPGVGGRTVIVRIGYSDQGSGHGSRNLELHETSHAIDTFAFGGVSSTRRFRELFAAEAPALFAGADYEEKYPEEYFAETVCLYYLSEETRAELRGKAPGTYAFLSKLFASHRAMPPGRPELAGHWARPALERLAGLRIMRGFGDGTLMPSAPVTRAQFMKLLAETAGLPAAPGGSGRSAFADVPAGNWAEPYVQAGVAAGVLPSTELGETFEPARPLTRGEMAVWLARALGLQPDGEAFAYSDREAVPDAARRALIGAVIRTKLMTGLPDGRFEPDGTVTRAQAAVVLDRLLNLPVAKEAGGTS